MTQRPDSPRPASHGASAEAPGHSSLLRFVMCGSVDDGKSTLIGRLLYDARALFADQIEALEADSKRIGTQGEELDFALLMDGLAAEREQGITIDVAYRYFSTEHRHFIVADTPGHEQYTRNMITGASTADCAVILADARKGILTQTRRHSHIVNLMGTRQVVLAVNKMDLVGYDQAAFEEIEREYRQFAENIGIGQVCCIPVSGFKGDNVTERSPNTGWYGGPTLMGYLDTVSVDEDRQQALPFRMPVQWVNRPNLDFRGFTGTVASGAIRPGDSITVAPSGTQSTVARIVSAEGDLDLAVAGQSITLTLDDEIGVTRGDVIAHVGKPPGVADQFEATVVWMGDEPLLRGREYLMKVGGRTVVAVVAPLKYKLQVDSLEHVAANKLELNEIGVCDLELATPLAFDSYSDNKETGGFILIDRMTNNTVGAGMIRFALRRSENIQWQAVEVDKAARAGMTRQQPTVVWLTGLSGAGKSTIANLVEGELHRRGHLTYMLDGDNIRHGLNSDLGFVPADRVENIRRVSEVSRLMVDAGLIVIVSFISPFQAERRMARERFAHGEFLEVFVDAPMSVVEARDTKGLYRKARLGELRNFTGIDSPYEPPESPELHLRTDKVTSHEAAAEVIAYLESNGRLVAPPG